MSLEERKNRMKNAGIPMPITQITEGSINAIPVTAQNADKHARLQALKSGANRNTVQNIIQNLDKSKTFQGIPETKQKKRLPQGQQGPPVQVVPVQTNFGPAVKTSGEFSAMEAMYGGGVDAPAYNIPQIKPNQPVSMVNSNTQPELTVQQDGYGPTFDPVGMLAKKRLQMSQSQPQQMVSEVGSSNVEQHNFNFQYMQQMMEQIAKNTISEVLNSYTEKNKDKLTYEHVNVKTSDGAKVIKTQDGKYYKLVPVTLKKG